MISDGRLYEVSCGLTKAIRSDGFVRDPCMQLHEGDDFLIAVDGAADHGAIERRPCAN